MTVGGASGGAGAGCGWRGRAGLGRLLAAGVVAWGMVLGQPAAQASETSGRVTLSWDASPGPDVVGYKLYYGRKSGSYDRQITVGKTLSASVPGLWPDRVYYFVVTALNADGVESEPSNEVRYPAVDTPAAERPPELPPIFGVKGTLPALLTSVPASQPAERPEVNFWATYPVDLTIPQTTTIGPPAILPDGGLSFTIHGPPGKWVGIYSSTDLRVWNLEGSAENVTGSMIIDRWISVSGPQRFFRCVEWETDD